MKKAIILLLLLCAVSSLRAQEEQVLFSFNGGFYETSFQLNLSCVYPNHHIRFTTNGNTPTVHSDLYKGPLTLDESLYSKSNLYTIVNSIPSVFYLPEDVQRAIVIRAAVFDENDSCVSPVVTNSYFIHSLGCIFHGLPVVSIVTDSLSLFDYETGIFIPGIHYDPSDSTHTGNYCQKGREWERLINVEFYEPDNTGINQPCGLRIHGGASRWFQQKGMRIYAREEYGKKRFKHQFFETIPNNSFKRLNLHPFRCSNWLQTGGQEYLAQTVASNLDIETLAVRQTVVFINGEYWGIYTLEESPDERYLEDHFDINTDEVNIIKHWGVTEHGNGADWWGFKTWMENADLSQPNDSAYAFSRIDVHSFIDYSLFETFTSNLDWPINNTLQWQAENGAPFRWIFYDGDGCFVSPEYNALGNALQQEGNSLIIKRFLENAFFRNAFYKRYLQLWDTYFSQAYLTSVLNRYRQTVEGEIAAQSNRFLFPESLEQWQEGMEQTEAFFCARPRFFKEELLDFVFVDEPQICEFSCSPNPSSGTFVLHLHSTTNHIVSVKIFDIMGRKVHSKDLYLLEGENNIPFQVHLSSGVYFIRANNSIHRILIQ